MMLSDGSGLVFTVREFLSPLGMYVRSIDEKEPHAVILIIQINQNCHENYFYRILRRPCLLIIFLYFMIILILRFLFLSFFLFVRYMGHGIKPNLLLNDPSKIDLRKIYFDNVLQKWELVEMSFADNCNNIFQ